MLLCLDNDSTGRIKTIHIASLLFEYGIDVKVINIKDCKDIADMDSEEWKKLYDDSLKTSTQYPPKMVYLWEKK